MKAYVATFSGKTFGMLRAYPSRVIAGQSGNYGTIFSSEEELLRSSVTIAQMEQFYNHFHPKAKIESFADREIAAKRIFALAQAKAEDFSVVREIKPEVKETVMETMKKIKAEKAPKAVKAVKAEKAPKAEKSGRSSEFSGKKLHAVEKENPRREGSHGHKSFQILLDHPGITYEKFLEHGGRAQDLRWDVSHGAVEVK